jgi:glycosyltransferase involved in cell wall biosynthesis
MTSRPRVVLIVGYFDWFSGYQETALAAALSEVADVEVIASDRVSPIFTDAHLARLGVDRTYATGSAEERGVLVTRLPTRELRSMVWSADVRSCLMSRECDLLIQVMPGQGLSAAGAFVPKRESRIALYGDNSAMWSALPRWKQRIKWIAFAATKGQLYRLVNRRSDVVYGYTPETIKRLDHFRATAEAGLLPLGFASGTFFHSPALRQEARARSGIADDETVIFTAGKVAPYKRLELLVDAFAQVHRDNPKARLVVVGADAGDYSDSLRRRAAPLGASAVFMEFQDSAGLNALFNMADIGVWPALPAVTIQQAMGTGLSVVLPRNEWVGHLIRPGSGRYFDPETGVDGLASSLRETLGTESSTPEARAARAANNAWLASEGIASKALEILAARGNLPVEDVQWP